MQQTEIFLLQQEEEEILSKLETLQQGEMLTKLNRLVEINDKIDELRAIKGLK